MFMIMLIENDVVIEDDIDNNWYEMMFVFMIILIWDNVVIDDYVDVLLIMSLRWDDVDVENDTEIRWYWCWEWHLDEMMLIMTSRWVVDVENVILMMCDVYVHGGV